jgi:hypothetical protein
LTRHLILIALLAAAPAFAQQSATGIVFDDRNGNGARDSGENGIANVRVSNQLEVVTTDADGRYTLPVTDDTIIFVVKPCNWATPVDKNMVPRYFYIHKPSGSPKQKWAGVAATGPLPASVDFPLRKVKEPNRFKALFFGDTQVNARSVSLIAREIIDDLVPGEAAFGITQGDNSADNPSLFGRIAETMGASGIPWHYTLGNHDENYDTPGEEHSTETFQSAFGPANNSFDYGPVHFVVMDSVKWLGKSYTGGFGENQIAWLKNDLALCPKDQLVVLSLHIPLGNVEDRGEVYRLLEDRPNVLVVAGHTHWMSNHFIGKEDGFNRAEPLHELINVTTCGSWWGGPPDEQGLPIPTMADGAPNGYTVISFSGSRYNAEFRPARRAATYQMTIFTPEEVTADKLAETEVLANVFAGSARSIVEMRIDNEGGWAKMEKVERPDPFLAGLKAAEAKSGTGASKYIDPMAKCPHLWRGVLPAGPATGAHIVNVRTTDMYGHTYSARRVIVVK